MPGTGVYFVNSASSALWAAALMASGVPKSGSPAPKSMTSTPARRSLSTAAPTAMVADVAILDVLSANRMISSLRTDGLFFPQTLLDELGHQAVHLAAEAEHFLD